MNSPSGIVPQPEDVEVTRTLIEADELMDKVLDHLVRR